MWNTLFMPCTPEYLKKSVENHPNLNPTVYSNHLTHNRKNFVEKSMTRKNIKNFLVLTSNISSNFPVFLLSRLVISKLALNYPAVKKII